MKFHAFDSLDRNEFVMLERDFMRGLVPTNVGIIFPLSSISAFPGTGQRVFPTFIRTNNLGPTFPVHVQIELDAVRIGFRCENFRDRHGYRAKIDLREVQ